MMEQPQMKCSECGRLHYLASLLPRSADPHSDPVCHECGFVLTIRRLEAENARLRHDITRQIEIANEHLNDNARLREAIRAARQSLPPDPSLNKEWSPAIAILDETLEGE